MLDKIERLEKELKRPERYKGEHATIKAAIDKEKERRKRAIASEARKEEHKRKRVLRHERRRKEKEKEAKDDRSG